MTPGQFSLILLRFFVFGGGDNILSGLCLLGKRRPYINTLVSLIEFEKRKLRAPGWN
jgi:hypothetical protein